jgi:biopolymer transport protein ExbD
MRRFSQRNSLVTLADINITPLLDLAFVLLIIFVITTPLLEKGFALKLPQAGGGADPKLDKRDIQTVEIDPHGRYSIAKRTMSLPQLIARLTTEYRANRNLVIYIRGDEDSPLKYTVALMDGCERNGIARYSLRTQPLEGQ